MVALLPIPTCYHCGGALLPDIQERDQLACIWCGRTTSTRAPAATLVRVNPQRLP